MAEHEFMFIFHNDPMIHAVFSPETVHFADTLAELTNLMRHVDMCLALNQYAEKSVSTSTKVEFYHKQRCGHWSLHEVYRPKKWTQGELLTDRVEAYIATQQGRKW